VRATLEDLEAVLARLRVEVERLEAENADLRRWLTSLLCWVGETDEFLTVARRLIGQRFPRRELDDDEVLALLVAARANERRAA
jgi:hypothetical protein